MGNQSYSQSQGHGKSGDAESQTKEAAAMGYKKGLVGMFEPSGDGGGGGWDEVDVEENEDGAFVSRSLLYLCKRVLAYVGHG